VSARYQESAVTKNLVQRALDASRAPMPYPTGRWLAARGLSAPVGERWKVTIGLECVNPRAAAPSTTPEARLQLAIENFEWSVMFCQGTGSSWIRVVDTPRIHERDDFGLLPHIPDLRGLGPFVQWIERRFRIELRRPHATIHTNLADAQQKILLWIVSAL
jgi:hypothetical protein